MEFCLRISHVNQYCASDLSDVRANGYAQFEVDSAKFPKLDWLKPMQRRRLSTFAKLGLHCAYQSMTGSEAQVDTIFSSRHGDLHKTSELLSAIAHDEALSPTTFSLSVHNAVAGLHSIFTGNKAANTAISAGKDTFPMALLDAYTKLTSGMSQRILLVHTDRVLPEPYSIYADEMQIDHAVACLITLPNEGEEALRIARQPTCQTDVTSQECKLPLSLALSQWLTGESKRDALMLSGQKSNWQVESYCA